MNFDAKNMVFDDKSPINQVFNPILEVKNIVFAPDECFCLE